MEYIQFYNSPLGRIILSSDGEKLTGLRFTDRMQQVETRSAADQMQKNETQFAAESMQQDDPLHTEGRMKQACTLQPENKESDLPVFAETGRWLDIYFSGRDPGFTPPLSMQGTVFRRKVWEILLRIPYGETMSYGEIAAIIKAENGLSRMSAQAVGGAVGHNPISLIVPCHRVIGADGRLTGYGGGLDRKQALLDLEMTGPEATDEELGQISAEPADLLISQPGQAKPETEPADLLISQPGEAEPETEPATLLVSQPGQAKPETEPADLLISQPGQAEPKSEPAGSDTADEAFEVFEEMCRELHGLNDY